MKMTRLLITSSILLSTGCTSAELIKPVTLPSGKTGFFVTCENGNHDWTTCYESARKACDGDYSVTDKSETSTPTPYGPLVKRNIMIDCKK